MYVRSLSIRTESASHWSHMMSRYINFFRCMNVVCKIILDCLHSYLPPPGCKDVVMEPNVVFASWLDHRIWSWVAMEGELGKGNNCPIWIFGSRHQECYGHISKAYHLFWKLMQYWIVEQQGFLDQIFLCLLYRVNLQWLLLCSLDYG